MNTQDQPLDFLRFLMLNIAHAIAIYGHSCSTNLYFFFYLYELGLQKVVRYNLLLLWANLFKTQINFMGVGGRVRLIQGR